MQPASVIARASRAASGVMLARSLVRRSVQSKVLFQAPQAQRLISTMHQPQMMCYQCEQTSAGSGCTTIGVCSKTPQLAGLQDLQVAYNKRLCQLGHLLGPQHPLFAECSSLMLESTFATLTNVNFDDSRFEESLLRAAALITQMETVVVAELKVAPPSPPPELPRSFPGSRQELFAAAGPTGLLARGATVGNDDLFGVVEMATYGFKGVSAYLYHAEHINNAQGPHCPSGPAYSTAEREEIFKELFRIGNYLALAGSVTPHDEAAALNEALGECLAIGALNVKVMKILDEAHRHALGTPSPAEVHTGAVGSRPSILVSGHDLGVLQSLLAQSEGHGIDIYTHGEMLPAHGYPGLRRYKHLKGHYGTHWGNQLHEFRTFPGAILMTSNCLRPPTKKYSDRIWTCGPVGFNNIPDIVGEDFSPLMNKALHIGKATTPAEQPVSGPKIVTGFGHEAVLGVADKVLGAIKSGELKHIFVIGGCDGTESSRSYFSDFAKATPKDSIILTLGCGKFRLLGDDHGTVAGLPRLLDMGQCNDAYSAVVVAQKLAEALGCGVNDLPLHFAVSWFEQKAVAVLLSLLHLELKNIRIGPAVPAFLTPRVRSVLQEKFNLRGISGHEDDDLEMMVQGQ